MSSQSPRAGLLVHTSTSFPSTDDWEDLIRVYLFNLFWFNVRGYRMYLQRSVLITTKAPRQLETELNILMDDLHERVPEKEFHYELLEQEFMYLKNKSPVVYDSAVVSISRPLHLARRSTRTGIVYDNPDMHWCPFSGTTMNYFISGGRLLSNENS